MRGTKLYGSLKNEIAADAGMPAEQLDDNRVFKMIVDDPQNDYDYRGAFKYGVTEQISPHDGLPHWDSRAQNGQWLKSPNHPTAWKEFFYQHYNADPDDIGLNSYEDAVKWSQSQGGTGLKRSK